MLFPTKLVFKVLVYDFGYMAIISGAQLGLELTNKFNLFYQLVRKRSLVLV